MGEKVEAKKVVSLAMWSVSGVIVMAVMVIVTGVPVWEPLAWVATWYVVTVGPVAMIAGLYIIWQFPGRDPRKLIVVGVEVFVIFCGVALFASQVDRSKADEQESQREAFLAGAEYRSANDAYELAKREWEAQVDRISKIPGDFTTGAKFTDKASEEAKANFETARDELKAVDAKAPKPGEKVGAAGLFRIFGKENADWFMAIMLLILGISHEAVALAMSWKSGTVLGQGVDTSQSAPQIEPKEEPAKVFTAEDYFKAATEGRTDGRLFGRAVVQERLGIPERLARHLRQECVKLGYIKDETPTAPKSAQLHGVRNEN